MKLLFSHKGMSNAVISIKSYITCILFLFGPSCALGKNLESLSIYVNNKTSTTCHLVNAADITTALVDLNDIKPGGESKIFVPEPVFAGGPEVTLTYDCGGKSITLSSQQDVVHFWQIFHDLYGEVHTDVIAHDIGINATCTVGVPISKIFGMLMV